MNTNSRIVELSRILNGSVSNVSRVIAAVTIFLLLVPPPPAKSQVFSAASDFSPTLNPNGAWSYGWSATLGGAFTLFNLGGANWRADENDPFEYWCPSSQDYPVLFCNPYPTNLTYGNRSLLARGLDLHPGPNGEHGVIRWIAPGDGLAAINGAFRGNEVGTGPTSDVHVMHNGESIFDGSISGHQTNQFSGRVIVAAGDTIDLAVGRGTNGTYLYDNTGVSATISFTSLLLSIRVSQVELCFDTGTNTAYQVQYRSDLTTNNWVPLVDNWQPGDGARFCTNDAVTLGEPQRFYRVAITNWAGSTR